ncbi:hypothetical protein NCLIV_049200 [Neospora caninum Liverpool]|uniref:GIY-YIG domain-containing protein n=1 Tax=Neospora caninum (strain Liverpool) TaxID=572307 RepID=F0VK90_NEOCL|nr:hypothetical protein NCLIV_049200 [Neospora caninum Liverpool]CBZ54491.1 hypothetical protein NCLIV_049200 [Neospora caninum Liverpool]|eukprot:XP_003884521.1 hypothetical protein NCLIV_049200 [Neospora caninum Liverpool]
MGHNRLGWDTPCSSPCRAAAVSPVSSRTPTSSPRPGCGDQGSGATAAQSVSSLEFAASEEDRPTQVSRPLASAEPALRARRLYDAFHCVYLLRSLKNPRYTYVGYSVHPLNRLKQHNGETAHGGAWKTQRHRPWSLVLVVHGFPTQVGALQFEWRWQRAAPALDFFPRGLSVPKARRGETAGRHLLLSEPGFGLPFECRAAQEKAPQAKETLKKRRKAEHDRQDHEPSEGHPAPTGDVDAGENSRSPSSSFLPFASLSTVGASSAFPAASARPSARTAKGTAKCLDSAREAACAGFLAPVEVASRLLQNSRERELRARGAPTEARPAGDTQTKRACRQPLLAQLAQQRKQAAGAAKTVAGLRATLACVQQTYKLSRTGGIVVCVGQRLRALLALLQAPPFSRMPLAIHVIDSRVAAPFFRSVLRQRRDFLSRPAEAGLGPAASAAYPQQRPLKGVTPGLQAAETPEDRHLLSFVSLHAPGASSARSTSERESEGTARRRLACPEPRSSSAVEETSTVARGRLRGAAPPGPALSTWKAAGLWLAPHTSVSFGEAELLLPLVGAGKSAGRSKRRRDAGAPAEAREGQAACGEEANKAAAAGFSGREGSGEERWAETRRRSQEGGAAETVVVSDDSEDERMETRASSPPFAEERRAKRRNPEGWTVRRVGGAAAKPQTGGGDTEAQLRLRGAGLRTPPRKVERNTGEDAHPTMQPKPDSRGEEPKAQKAPHTPLRGQPPDVLDVQAASLALPALQEGPRDAFHHIPLQ